VAFDTYFGGHEKSIEAGQAYYRGVTSLGNTDVVITYQNGQTVAAINFVRDLASNLIVNHSVTPLQARVPPYSDVALAGGNIAAWGVTSNFNVVTDIIANGMVGGPSSLTRELLNAAALLAYNMPFIRSQTTQWVSANYPTLLSAPQLQKCGRDIGLILGGIMNDVLLGGTANTVAAGNSYWNGVVSILPPGEQTVTVAALNYALSLLRHLLSNELISPDYPTTPTTSQQVDQLFQGARAADAAIEANAALLESIITGGLSQLPSNPVCTQSGNFDAQTLIYDNLEFIAAEVTAFIDATYPAPAYTYNTAKCARDVGIILNCIMNDVLGGYTFNSKLAGNGYWQSQKTVIPGQVSVTVAALDYMRTVMSRVVSNSVIANPSQAAVAQVIDGAYANGGSWTTKISSSISLIQSILSTGPVNFQLASPGYDSAQTLGVVNIPFIKAEVNAYVTSQTFFTAHPGFSLTPIQLEKCSRDVGLIVGAVLNDSVEGGTTNSEMAGKAYWNGTTSLVAGQQAETIDALYYAKTLLDSVVTNTAFAPLYQNTVQQITIPEKQGGAIALAAIGNCFSIITNFIANGNGSVPLYVGNGGVQVTSITPTTYDSASAWRIVFANGLHGDYVGPKKFVSYTGPMVFVSAQSLRPYRGVGLNSMVLDAFTQYNEISYTTYLPNGATVDVVALDSGGNGIVIKNGGYAQLVSIFEICCNIGVLCQSGGTCSITNSNTDFGNYGLWADGMSDLQYSASVVDYDPLTGRIGIEGLPGQIPTRPVSVSNMPTRPYVGQVVTIGNNGQPYYYIDYIEVTYGGLGYDPNNPNIVQIQPPADGLGGFAAQATATFAYDEASEFYYISGIVILVSGRQFTRDQLNSPGFIAIDAPTILAPGAGGATAEVIVHGYPIYYTVLSADLPALTNTGNGMVGISHLYIDETIPMPVNPGDTINFFQVSRIISSSHSMEYVGSGTDIGKCIPARGGVPIQANEVVETNGGRVAFTSTDHLGNFRIGLDLQINQNTGTLSGRTFTKSLYAIMTPFILAIEGS
jgi:hypothetical protein